MIRAELGRAFRTMWAAYVLAAWGAASIFVAWVAVARAVVRRYDLAVARRVEQPDVIPPPM